MPMSFVNLFLQFTQNKFFLVFCKRQTFIEVKKANIDYLNFCMKLQTNKKVQKMGGYHFCTKRQLCTRGHFCTQGHL